MSGPITWRNVDGPSFSGISNILGGAQQAISTGLESFNNVLNKQTNLDDANWDQAKKNNTSEFLNKIYAETGADGYKKLQESGQLQGMLERFGAQIDQAKARETMDTRLGTLQARDKAGWEYENAALDQKEAPVVDQAKALIAQGKVAEATPLINSLSTRNQVGLFQSSDARTQEELMRTREAKKFGWLEEEHPLNILSKKTQIAGQQTQNAIGKINLTKAQQEQKDALETRALTNEFAGAQQNYVAQRNALGKEMGAFAATLTDAKGNKLPMTMTGHPNFDIMSEDQIKLYDAAAKTAGKPLAKTLMAGDTQAGNDYYQSLVDSKKYTPAVLNKFRDNIRSSFNTDLNSTLVGNDAANRTLDNAREKVIRDEQDANNWYAPGSANALRNYEELAKAAEGIYKDSGFMATHDVEDLPDIQEKLHKIALEGIKVNGKTVVPSKNDIMAAMRATESGAWTDTQGANRIERYLIKTLSTANSTKRLAEGEDNAAYRRREAVKKIINLEK